jgi:hypothetical protein
MMGNKSLLLFLAPALFFLLYSSSTIAAGKNNCLVCHTSDATIKLLYKPPAMVASEGEG